MAIDYDAGPTDPHEPNGEVHVLQTQPPQLSTTKPTGKQKRPGEVHPAIGGGLQELGRVFDRPSPLGPVTSCGQVGPEARGPSTG